MRIEREDHDCFDTTSLCASFPPPSPQYAPGVFAVDWLSTNWIIVLGLEVISMNVRQFLAVTLFSTAVMQPLSASANDYQVPDVSKRSLESTLERTIGRGGSPVRRNLRDLPLLQLNTPAPTADSSTVSNRAGRKVVPGFVRWHTNFETACKRAASTNKPVLLFQMMGKLDEEFC